MAKKDRKEDGDEYQFEMPDFDEDAFIHKELTSFKTTSILFGVGILTALISWIIFEFLGGAKLAWFIGLVLVGVAGYLLRFIYPLLKADISHFGRREWFGTFFLLFFAWLAFFILFVNPPISDHADPTADVFVSPRIQQAGSDVTIDLFVADNHRVSEMSFIVQSGGNTIFEDDTMDDLGHGHFQKTLVAPATGVYSYEATAMDKKGNEAVATGTFRVSVDAMTVDLPADGTLDGTDTVFVQVLDMEPCDNVQRSRGGNCLRTVYLHLADGDEIHMEYDASFSGWKATAAFDGWKPGNNQFSVVAEQMNRFHAASTIEGGDTIAQGPFSVQVPNGGGEYTVDVTPEIDDNPNTRQTPGFEAVALLGVLVGGVLIARRRQE